MSLSKPVVGELNSSATSSSFSRSIQLGLIFGVPLAALVGFCWWKGLFTTTKDSKSDQDKKLDQKKNSSTTTRGSSLKKSEVSINKPEYLKLKEEGNACFKKGEYGNALELYASAAALNPPPTELATLYQNRAAVFEKLGEWVQVIAELSLALSLNPTYIKALHRRSRAYRATGFHDEALEDITAVCVLESFSNASSIQMADELLKEIGGSEARRLMRDKKPTCPSPHTVLSFLRGFYCDPVSVWFRQSPKLPNGNSGDGQTTEPHALKGFEAALHALQSKSFENIIELCTEEINDPKGEKKDEAHFLRGTFYHLWGYHSEVLDDFDAVINSETASHELKSSAFIKKGSEMAMLGEDKYEEYESCFRKAEELWPDNVDIYHQKGQLFLIKADFEGAVAQINKAHDMCPDFALAVGSKWYIEYRIAALNQNHSGMSSALKNFSKALRKFPSSPDVFNLYGQILMEEGKYPEALEQFSTVSSLDPTNAAVVVHRAVAQFQMDNDMDRVLKVLYESLAIDDKSEFVYETIGSLELQAGNLENAIKAFNKALELAKSAQELMMLSSLKKAAEVQVRVKAKYNIEVPSINSLPPSNLY